MRMWHINLPQITFLAIQNSREMMENVCLEKSGYSDEKLIVQASYGEWGGVGVEGQGLRGSLSQA